MTSIDHTSLASLHLQDGHEANAEALFNAGAAFDEFTSQTRRAFELNAHERLAISVLWARGPMTMTDLGTWIPLSRAAVTTLVDRLSDAGFVTRGSDAQDRRRTVVEITDAAVDRMRPVLREWGKALSALVAKRSGEEWRVITSFLAEYAAMNRQQAERLAALPDEQIQQMASARDTEGN